MYEMNEVWREFYEELDPTAREQIFAEIKREVEDDGLNAFRKKILKKRYHNPKDPENRYPFDLFLQQFVVLPVLYKRRKFPLTNVKKHAKFTVEALFLDEELTDDKKNALYWEFRNMARRYFNACQGVNYGRNKFSRTEASVEEKQMLMLQEAWRMSRGIGIAAKMEDKFELLSQAIRDELEAFLPGMGEKFDNYSE